MELLVNGHYSSVPENMGVGPGLCNRLQVHLDSQAGTSLGTGVVTEGFLAMGMDRVCIGSKWESILDEGTKKKKNNFRGVCDIYRAFEDVQPEKKIRAGEWPMTKPDRHGATKI